MYEENIKNFLHTNKFTIPQNPQNKFSYLGENNIMKNSNNQNVNKCKIHTMPTTITDNDISALFNGLLNVVKKKFELDNQATIIDMNTNMQTLASELKSKIAECNRLKNEIIHLKSLLANNHL